MVHTRETLVSYWRARHDEYARVDAVVNGAKLINEMLHHIQELFTSEHGFILSLEAAALRSGYSKEHLARLIRQGKIPNAGRRGTPRIRVEDLPRRRSNLGRQPEPSYNPKADAWAIRDRLRGP